MIPCPHCGKPAGQNDLRPPGEMICHHCGHDWLTKECEERYRKGREAHFAESRATVTLSRAESRALSTLVVCQGNKLKAAERLRIHSRAIDYHLVRVKKRLGTSGTVETLFRLGLVRSCVEVEA